MIGSRWYLHLVVVLRAARGEGEFAARDGIWRDFASILILRLLRSVPKNTLPQHTSFILQCRCPARHSICSIASFYSPSDRKRIMSFFSHTRKHMFLLSFWCDGHSGWWWAHFFCSFFVLWLRERRGGGGKRAPRLWGGWGRIICGHTKDKWKGLSR